MQKAKPLPRLPVPEGAADHQASSIGINELVEDNLELTRLYKDLTTRHNALVDAVVEKLKQQAGDDSRMPAFLKRLIN